MVKHISLTYYSSFSSQPTSLLHGTQVPAEERNSEVDELRAKLREKDERESMLRSKIKTLEENKPSTGLREYI